MVTISQLQEKLETTLNERYAICSYKYLTDDQRKANQCYYDGFCAAVALIGSWERREDGTHSVYINHIASEDEDEWTEWGD